jgi:hypothetical protein
VWELLAGFFGGSVSYSGQSSSSAISEPMITAGLDGSNWTVATGSARASATNTDAQGVPVAAAVDGNEKLLWIFGGAAALVLVWNLTKK